MTGRRKYSHELKTEAINMVLVQGIVQEEVARTLSIPSGTLVIGSYGTRLPHRKGSLVNLQLLIFRMKTFGYERNWQKQKLEREITKKGAAYFANESMQSTRS